MKRAEIEQLLPGIFQRTVHRGNPLYAVLEVMESLHAPDEAVLDRLDEYFDPRRAPDAFVPYLATWLDLERLLPPSQPGRELQFAPGLGRLRELVADAAYLFKWRGTATGMLRFLETATGVPGFRIDEQVRWPDGRPRPFHLLVHAPAASAPYEVLIERIIESEKPAYVTYELEFGS